MIPSWIDFNKPRMSDVEVIECLNYSGKLPRPEWRVLCTYWKSLDVLDLAVNVSFGFHKWKKKTVEIIENYRITDDGREFPEIHRVAARLWKEDVFEQNSILKEVYSFQADHFENCVVDKLVICDLVEHREVFTELCPGMPSESLRERLMRHFRLFTTLRPRIMDQLLAMDPEQVLSMKNCFQITAELLFQKFERDSELVLEFVRSLCFREDLQQAMFRLRETQFLLHRCAELGFDFWGFRCNSRASSNHYNTVMNCFVQGWHRNIPKLVNLGFSYKFTEDGHNILCYQLSFMRLSGALVMRRRHLRTLMQQWRNKRITMALQRFMTSLSAFSNYHILGEDALVFLSKVSPEPHLAPFEIIKYLKRYVRPGLWPALLEKSHEYRDANMFEDNYHDYVPRRLKHLSRCTVRESLSANCQLPGGVKKLKIPKKLKYYLLLR